MAAIKSLRQFTEEDFREFVERDERRKDLEREARQLKAENDLVAADLLASLQAEQRTAVSRGSFKGEIKESKGAVAWKEAFLRVAGAEEANKLTQAAPMKQSVTIVRVS